MDSLLALPDTPPLSKSNTCSFSTVIVSRVFQWNIGPKLKTIGTSQKASTWNIYLSKSNNKQAANYRLLQRERKKISAKVKLQKRNR